MTSEQTFVTVGAGLAGAKAAETLRTEAFEERVVIVGAERERPNERPPLSKQYLRGEVGRDWIFVHDEGFYADHHIEPRLGRAVAHLDTDVGQVALDDGTRLRYDRLLIATGAEPRCLSVAGEALDGVVYLRMEHTGFARTWDRVVFRDDPGGREFIAFCPAKGGVLAGMNVGVWDVADAIERLIRSRATVDQRRLADPDLPLDLVHAAGASAA